MSRWIVSFLILLPTVIGSTLAQPDCTGTLELWEIQGAGAQANCLDERVVTENNIITAVGRQGFFMQTPAERIDGDDTTSDGIYVFLNGSPVRWGIAVGDLVNVTGRVQEYYDFTELSIAGQRGLEIVSSENPLPEPINLATVDLTPGEVHPLERYEGMLVEIEDAFVTASTNQFDEFDITLDGTRSFREAGLEPDAMPQFAGIGLPEWDLNPELVEIDALEMGLPVEQVNVGSRVSVLGGLAYSYLDYQIWPDTLVIDRAELTPRPVRERAEGEFTVAAQNVENFFDTVDDANRQDSLYEDYVPDDAAAYQMRLESLSEQVRMLLNAPDILALEEVENSRTLTDLILQIYTDDPTLRYAGCLLEGNDPRGIDVAFLVRVDHVNILDCHRLPGALDTRQRGSSLPLFGRPPLVLEAEYVTGDDRAFPITLIAVHIRSLSDLEQASTQVRRLEQAVMIADYVQQRQTADPDLNLVVLGDMNGFQFSDGIVDVVNIIAGTYEQGTALAEPEGDIVEPNLVNQVFKLPPEERYSYVYNGSAQVLDHILTSAALDAFITDVQYSRGNADAPRLLEAGNRAMGSSDHDGMVIYIQPQ